MLVTQSTPPSNQPLIIHMNVYMYMYTVRIQQRSLHNELEYCLAKIIGGKLNWAVTCGSQNKTIGRFKFYGLVRDHHKYTYNKDTSTSGFVN